LARSSVKSSARQRRGRDALLTGAPQQAGGQRAHLLIVGQEFGLGFHGGGPLAQRFGVGVADRFEVGGNLRPHGALHPGAQPHAHKNQHRRRKERPDPQLLAEKLLRPRACGGGRWRG